MWCVVLWHLPHCWFFRIFKKHSKFKVMSKYIPTPKIRKDNWNQKMPILSCKYIFQFKDGKFFKEIEICLGKNSFYVTHCKYVHWKYHEIILFLKYHEKLYFFEIFLHWFKSVWYDFFPKKYNWKYHIFAVLGTVIKCQKGTGSAWEKTTTKSCVFYKQYICSEWCSQCAAAVLIG